MKNPYLQEVTEIIRGQLVYVVELCSMRKFEFCAGATRRLSAEQKGEEMREENP